MLQKEASQSNKNVRPLAKTHKCVQIYRLQIEQGAIGICVTKVSEAGVLVENGFKNTLVTSPVVTPIKATVNVISCVT